MLQLFVPLLCSCALLALAGCGQRDEIARYTVPKPELVDPTLVTAPGKSAEAAAQQTLAAILIAGDMGWFFKVTGQPQAVEPERERFLSLVKSVKFSAGSDPKPSWTLPEGWKEQPGSGMRFATIQIAADGKPLELTVIPLPKTEADTQKFVLDNINRWRGQVGLQPIAAGELASTTEAFKVGEYEATFVSLVGTGSGGMSAPFAPFAGGGRTSGGGSGAGGAATPRASGDKRPPSGDIAYDAPPEWQPGTPNQFSLAAFTVSEGPQKVNITVSSAGGDLLTNINRWRGQVKLAPMTESELAATAQKIATLGGQGDSVELPGPADALPRQAILGVVATAGGRTWFVKLIGDHDLALREKSRFEQFVKSLKLRSP